MAQPAIGLYPHRRPATLHDYDPRAPAVAMHVAKLIRGLLPRAEVEHIGSTAVPGCAGKGIVDLMVVAHNADELAAIKAALAELGFQPQCTRDPWPEERPMRTGSVQHQGERFLLHVHVIPIESPEVANQRRFRERLRSEPALREAYVARKRAIIESGVTDSIDYSIAKGSFVERVLADSR